MSNVAYNINKHINSKAAIINVNVNSGSMCHVTEIVSVLNPLMIINLLLFLSALSSAEHLSISTHYFVHHLYCFGSSYCSHLSHLQMQNSRQSYHLAIECSRALSCNSQIFPSGNGGDQKQSRIAFR